jgi:hypothetical protein
MNEKDRLKNFKALLKSEKSNSIYLVDPDGEFRLWRELSAEGKLDIIARDAAHFGVTFEQFAKAARESIDGDALQDAALRLAIRKEQELTAVERLFPDDDRIEGPPPLIERVSELLKAAASEREDEIWPTAEEQKELFEEMRGDEAAAKREDAHWYGKLTLQELRDEKANSAMAEKSKDRDIDRDR